MTVTKIPHARVDERRAPHAGREPVPVPLTGGSRSLEVRWIRRGPLPTSLIDRFGPFRDPIERRPDRYLVDPWTAEFGVKIRGGVQLDLKAYRGSPGRLRVPGGSGRLEVWEKWSLPLRATDPEEDAGGWITLDKTRRRRAFGLTADGLVECSVLDEVGARLHVRAHRVRRWGRAVVDARLGSIGCRGDARVESAGLRRHTPRSPAARSHQALGESVDVLHPLAADAPTDHRLRRRPALPTHLGTAGHAIPT